MACPAHAHVSLCLWLSKRYPRDKSNAR